MIPKQARNWGGYVVYVRERGALVKACPGWCGTSLLGWFKKGLAGERDFCKIKKDPASTGREIVP